VFEPAGKIYATAVPATRSRGFTAGRAAERLFWRNAPLAGWARSLVSHPAALLNDVAQVGLHPALLTHWLGRLMGCLEQSSHRKRHAHLLELAELHAAHEAALANEGASLHRLRMDMAHRQHEAQVSGVRSKAA